MYQNVDAALLRAATHTDGLELPPWPDLTVGADGQVEQWRRWLEQVWAHDSVAEAVEIASPVLARRVREVCGGRPLPPRQVRGMVMSVARYLLRTTSRATPFGLFAGVAPAGFGPRLELRWGEDHHAVARADAVWLAGVITDLEACPELLRRLPVVANNLCFVRGDRLVVPCQQQPGGAGRGDPAEVSVRRTRAVETAVRAAQSPVLVGDLAEKLLASFPGTPQRVIEGMLVELVARRVLLSGLRPPMTVTDALGHVVERLTAAGADTIAQVAPQVRTLCDIQHELARHNRTASPAARREIRAAVISRTGDVGPPAVRQPLAVDLRLDCSIVLPEVMAREAEAAAAALTRLAPYPSVSPTLRDCHARFLDRYGIGALVPVAECVNADTGLGFPAGYRDSVLKAPPQPLPDRDVRLFALAQRAALDGGREIVLDDQAVSELAGRGATVTTPPHTELCVRVHAPTADALNQGTFTLVVVDAARAAGTTAGRFLYLLDAADRDRMARAYSGLPTVEAGAVPVQLSAPPLYAQTENVTRVADVLPRLLSIAEHPTATGGGNPGSNPLPLDDLAVGADWHRLYLTSLSQGKTVEPVILSAVELRDRTQPIVRFLFEITRSWTARRIAFSWGAASGLPFLPRVRYGRTVLSSARWYLSDADLPTRNAPWSEWAEGVADWRRRFYLPDAVYLGRGDRRIRLDLAEPAHLYLLRSQLDRDGHATLSEAPDTSAYGWFDGRAHEIVVPLASTASTSRTVRPPVPRRSAPVRAVGREHGHLPGCSEWLFAKLYAQPDRHADILTTHIPVLLSSWDSPPEWWYVRYRDPDPHLRLRFRLSGADAFGQAANLLGAWVADLRRLGLANRMQIDTYYPETGRYGTGAAMAAAEAVFAADSVAAVAQLTHIAGGSPHPHAVTAASFADLVITFTGSTGDGVRWLISNIASHPAIPARRAVHNEAMRLADPRGGWAAVRAAPGGDDIAEAWSRRRTALTDYRSRLTEASEIEPACVLSSLLHMHHARINGVDEDAERACLRLARAAALAWAARNPQSEQ